MRQEKFFLQTREEKNAADGEEDVSTRFCVSSSSFSVEPRLTSKPRLQSASSVDRCRQALATAEFLYRSSIRRRICLSYTFNLRLCLVRHQPHITDVKTSSGSPSPTVLLLGSTRTANHQSSLPRSCSVGRRASCIVEGVGEVVLEFRNFTTSVVEANSPLLGWIRLDADLNEILATSQVRDFLLLDLGPRLET
ncbi:hypothetical protein E6C27_scaffold219G002590 [Cucumis melo var. makuwa]|uniref:Uncharacterized protein n=1 Tax=Cucumis melo var. makuwa TaxID=1194695 RepID=A0A5A7ST44_CUCMM|nr:hypothetical protein E6C27_scaffold219G002590 [Cucumis melo var. makuwa]